MTNTKATKHALISSVVALFLCFSMLLGTTFAWFTDSVTSANNIIKSGKLNVEMYWADGATEVPTIGAEAWKDASDGPIFTDDVLWEPGYIDAKHILIANAGTLDLNYELRITTNEFLSELADVIDVYYFADAQPLTRDTVESGTLLGTLADIMGTTHNISKTVRGSLVVSDEDTENDTTALTLAFVMRDSAGNEYQELALANFSVQLIATQMASESDSFDNEYDKEALSSAVPAAVVKTISPSRVFAFTRENGETVTVLEKGLKAKATSGIGRDANDLVLNAAYQFEPSQTAEAMELSEYKYYLADFIVSADKDVPAGSMALAGYYDAWCQFNNDNWVAMSNEGEVITAGTELRLVQLLGAAVHYKDICQYGNDGIGFVCGIADLTGANAGTTVTVKLCLFETTADPNGSSAETEEVEGAEPIVIGEFKYTFPATTVADQADLEDVIDNADDDIVISLGAGNYTLPNTNGKTVEIIGTKDTVIDTTSGYYADQANLTFKGVTFNCTMDNANGGDYELIYSPNATFIDCTFNGGHGVGRDGASYIGCTFNLPLDYVWSFANDTVFDGCTFNSQGKALLLYNHGGSETVKVTVKNCVFNATEGAKAGAIANQNCAAIEIDNYGCSFKLVTENNIIDTDFSGEWRIKTFYNNDNTVIVNGTEYTTIAIDGKTMTIDADRNVTVQQ